MTSKLEIDINSLYLFTKYYIYIRIGSLSEYTTRPCRNQTATSPISLNGATDKVRGRQSRSKSPACKMKSLLVTFSFSMRGRVVESLRQAFASFGVCMVPFSCCDHYNLQLKIYCLSFGWFLYVFPLYSVDILSYTILSTPYILKR